MSNKTTNMHDYSLDDIKRAAKNAIVTGLLAQSTSVAGKSITFASLDQARQTYEWACRLEDEAAGNSGGFALLVNRGL